MRRRGWWLWLPVLAYGAMIFYFSSRPGGTMPRWEWLRHDKVLHLFEYAGFGVVVSWALRRRGLGEHRAALVSVIFAIVYGMSDEFHQTFVPGRQGNDPGDLLADSTGGLLGVVALQLAARRFPSLTGEETR